MKNWSGFVKWSPAQFLFPQSETEIQQIVIRALEKQKKIRLIGSGHSFTPLSVTNDLLISLDKFQGLVSIDKIKKQVTVKAGTKLNLLNELLAKEGLAMTNMGDINVQSIAGAISTGTHGTGTAFGNMSTQIVKIKLINGEGKIITCSANEHPDLFKAAQISLGALGILTEITIQCVPMYTLKLVVEKERLESVLEKYPDHNSNNRNFEFFWFPNTHFVLSKKSNISNEPVDKNSFRTYLQEMILENYGFKMLNELSFLFPKITHKLSSFAANTTEHHQKINYSHQVFSTPRMVKFNEMEYNVPLEAYPEVKSELVRWVNKNNMDVLFPIENRFVKGDDICLSPAYLRDSAYIAVHVYHKKDFKAYFNAIEDIFQSFDGRPHWGKKHSLTYDTLLKRYPLFSEFLKIRAKQDPNQIFISTYLQSLFFDSKSKL